MGEISLLLSISTYFLKRKERKKERNMSTDTSKQPTVSTVDHATTTATTTILPDDNIPTTLTDNADEQVIVSLGYRQEFKREFSLWTTFCVSFAVLGLLPSFASTMTYGMSLVSVCVLIYLGGLIELIM